MELSEFRPVSELKVRAHEIQKPKYPVFDTHIHLGPMVFPDAYEQTFQTESVVHDLKRLGIFKIISPDTAYGKELDRMRKKLEGFQDFIWIFASVDLSRVEAPDFEAYVSKTIASYAQSGIRGLKFWKDLGLSYRKKDGTYLRLDDPLLQVIWQSAAEWNMPVIIHVGDPVAFFKPIDHRNERYEELGVHPEWSFCQEGLYTFEALMEMQENLLAQNRRTTFIVAHCGSYAENLAFVGGQLDRNPNLFVDITERISELGRQPYTARRFLTDYQDRVLFGTDFWPGRPYLHQTYYRFLETYDEYFPYDANEIPSQGRWRIYGVGLDDAVLRKIYYKNASTLFELPEPVL